MGQSYVPFGGASRSLSPAADRFRTHDRSLRVGRAAGDLLDRMEQLKQSDEDTQRVWAVYCQQKGDGVLDPTKQSADFVQRFLDLYGGEKATEDEVARLIPLVSGDAETNAEWRRYCIEDGIAVNDPRMLSRAFVQRFLAEHEGRPKKDPLVEEMSQRIAALLSTDVEAKQLWELYCQERGDPGSSEPSVCSAKFLTRFLAFYAPGRASEDIVGKVAQLREADPSFHFQWGQYCFHEGIGLSDAPLMPGFFVERFLAAHEAGDIPQIDMVTDEMQSALAELQSKDLQMQAAWEAYCKHEGDGTADPKLLSADFVQQFLSRSAATIQPQ